MLEMIAAQTLRAARTGNSLVEKPEIDLLLRLAGTKQIGEAFKRIGYGSKKKGLFVIAASEGRLNDLRLLETKLSKFKAQQLPRRDLDEHELRSVERAALLASSL